MENPNEYDDDAYTSASMKLHEAIGALWEAGASERDIENEIGNAIQEAQQE